MKKKIFLVAICFVVVIFVFNGVSAKVAMPSKNASADEIDKYIKEECSNGGATLLSMLDEASKYKDLVLNWYETIHEVWEKRDREPENLKYQYVDSLLLVFKNRIHSGVPSASTSKNALKKKIEEVRLIADAPTDCVDVKDNDAMLCAQKLLNWVSTDMLNESGKGLNMIDLFTVANWLKMIDNGIDNINRTHNTNYKFSEFNTLYDYLHVVSIKKDMEYGLNVSEEEKTFLSKNEASIKKEFREKITNNVTLYICKLTVDGTYRWSDRKYTDTSVILNGSTTDEIYAVFRRVSEGNKSICSDEGNNKYDYAWYYRDNGELTYDQYARMYENYKVSNNKIIASKYHNYISSGSVNDVEYSSCNDGWWKCAWSFLRSGNRSNHQFGTNTGADRALNDIKSMIFDVGNLIFLLVTAYLGVKYIWGGVDSKFTVKNSLMTLIVAAIVFYGWDSVTKILDIPELLTGSAAASGETAMANKIYNTIMYIINFAAVGGIIYIGIRYMMAGADGKAELKLKGIPVVMGIMMVYGTLNFINFILKIVEGL